MVMMGVTPGQVSSSTSFSAWSGRNSYSRLTSSDYNSYSPIDKIPSTTFCTSTTTVNVTVLAWRVTETLTSTFHNLTIIPEVTRYSNGTNVTNIITVTPTETPSISHPTVSFGGSICGYPDICVEPIPTYGPCLVPPATAPTSYVPISVTSLVEKPWTEPVKYIPETTGKYATAASGPSQTAARAPPGSPSQPSQTPTSNGAGNAQIPQASKVSPFVSMLLPSTTLRLEPGQKTGVNDAQISFVDGGSAIVIGTRTISVDVGTEAKTLTLGGSDLSIISGTHTASPSVTIVIGPEDQSKTTSPANFTGAATRHDLGRGGWLWSVLALLLL
ncbi:unnamed protein product [Periconia digitata]|uniref:Uncharacterized protein n=1 Tax=Periconia digitata TaxID=1303443 RepID=A0A9W4UGN4_9PLEO|nr:unnamed protein product [Periconia digitata]